jgi:hypothetical protein
LLVNNKSNEYSHYVSTRYQLPVPSPFHAWLQFNWQAVLSNIIIPTNRKISTFNGKEKVLFCRNENHWWRIMITVKKSIPLYLEEQLLLYLTIILCIKINFLLSLFISLVNCGDWDFFNFKPVIFASRFNSLTNLNHSSHQSPLKIFSKNYKMKKVRLSDITLW